MWGNKEKYKCRNVYSQKRDAVGIGVGYRSVYVYVSFSKQNGGH